MTLSPTLDTWLTHFATDVAPKVPWYLDAGALRVDGDTVCCPLQEDWWQRFRRVVSSHPAILAASYATSGVLRSHDALLVIDAADVPPPYPADTDAALPVLRARLLAACGLEDTP